VTARRAANIAGVQAWPVTIEDVRAARERLRGHLVPSPLRSYAALDGVVGRGIRVWVKHENHHVYPFTFAALQEGLAGFVAVSEAELAEATRLLIRTTHTLVEGAGAAGLAGLFRLRETLAGRQVGIVISGGNVDEATLRRLLDRQI
jgi:threonine dehydratase